MAKINHILFGQGKGKVGGLVLQRYEGMNVVREKPISVKNPQSEKQTTQRGKLKLASQITAQFNEVFTLRLALFSIYERARRSAAVSAITKVISDVQPESPRVLVENVANAINAKSVSGLPSPAVSVTSDNFSIVAADGDTCTYVMCDYDDNGILIARESETYESDGTAKTVSFGEHAANSVLMAVSYHATTEAGRAILGNSEMADDTFSLTISRGVAAGDIEITNLGAEAHKA